MDVVGFTDIAETMGPERAYFAVTGAVRIVDEIARRHGGAVDKFLSDCLLAMFGYPVPIPDAASAAAAAAVEMRDELRAYNASLDVPLRIVIGINTGELVAGDVRGRVAREFNILGDAVNVAARLQQLCKEEDRALLVSAVAYERARAAGAAVALAPRAPVVLRGRRDPIGVLEG